MVCFWFVTLIVRVRLWACMSTEGRVKPGVYRKPGTAPGSSGHWISCVAYKKECQMTCLFALLGETGASTTWQVYDADIPPTSPSSPSTPFRYACFRDDPWSFLSSEHPIYFANVGIGSMLHGFFLRQFSNLQATRLYLIKPSDGTSEKFPSFGGLRCTRCWSRSKTSICAVCTSSWAQHGCTHVICPLAEHTIFPQLIDLLGWADRAVFTACTNRGRAKSHL